MLLPHEDSYVPFLRQRGIALEEMTHIPGLEHSFDDEGQREIVLRRSRKLLETDRVVMLKANKAYVSFIRAYQEHQLSYLFPFKSLCLGSLASGFSLLRL